MVRIIAFILMLSSPAFAQTADPARDCAPGSQTSAGTDCTKPENKQTEMKPPLPKTDMKDTVIPKAGATQTPDTTPTTGVNK